jgi:hypothetical protein
MPWRSSEADLHRWTGQIVDAIRATSGMMRWTRSVDGQQPQPLLFLVDRAAGALAISRHACLHEPASMRIVVTTNGDNASSCVHSVAPPLMPKALPSIPCLMITDRNNGLTITLP